MELVTTWVFLFDYDVPVYKYSLVINSAINVIAVYIFIRVIKTSESRLPQKTNIKWYLFAFLIGSTYYYIQLPLNKIYYLVEGSGYNILIDFDGIKNLKNIRVIAIILLMPITEELFFREYIQQNLQKAFKPVIAIIIASLLFAALHLPYSAYFVESHSFSFHTAYIALFGGLISGVIYYRSKSIGPSIVMHIMWNFVVTLA